MSRLFAAILIPFVTAAAFAFEFNIDPTQTGSIVVSSNPGSPTQIFVNDMSAMRTYIVNSSTNNIFIVGFSTTSALSVSSASVVSTNLSTGSFYIAGATTTVANGPVVPTIFSPDGVNDPYRGPIWAVSGGSGSVIQRFRAH